MREKGTTVIIPGNKNDSKDEFSPTTSRRKKIIAVQGVTGAQGLQGVQGPSNGATGFQGVQGYPGSQGYSGNQGATGASVQGIQGIQGVNAGQGATGTQGYSGTQGSGGLQGIQGIQGTNAGQGATGYQGATGTQGYGGLQGLIGPQGLPGTAASQGATGIQGTQGLQGPSGTGTGITLNNGVDNRVVTASGASTLNGESGLTYNGTTLNVSGAVVASNSMTATNFLLSSDERLKTKIKTLMPEKMDIRFKQFFFKSESDKIRYGVIAQELQEKYPELVVVAKDGTLSVSYIDLIIRYLIHLEGMIMEIKCKE